VPSESASAPVRRVVPLTQAACPACTPALVEPENMLQRAMKNGQIKPASTQSWIAASWSMV
jgi:hypothetical protein